jgi:hypothetical protein
MHVIFCSIGNNFTQPTWINILRYIHFSTVCSERDSLKMCQLWRQIAGLGPHLIDLKIWDMVLNQNCNNGNYLTFWKMSCFFLCTLLQILVKGSAQLKNQPKSKTFGSSSLGGLICMICPSRITFLTFWKNSIFFC